MLSHRMRDVRIGMKCGLHMACYFLKSGLRIED